MRCQKCKGIVYHNNICRKHFAEQIEGRIKKEIRMKQFVEKGDVFLVKDLISECLLKNVVTMPIKIVKKGSHDKELVTWTLDDEAVDFLSRFFNKRPLKEEKKDKKKISLVRTVKEDELKAYAKMKKIRFRPRKWSGEQKEIKAMLDLLEKRHPETKFSLLKSVEQIKALG